ncbi:hypothetical protein GJ496_002265 [Pomphorhynchus laevis]|nr:hypothetical protein GJ496_002265 [Pomphorhynchus laevis]
MYYVVKYAIFSLLIILTISKASECLTHFWPPDERSIVKEHTINLDLAPEDRWTEIMREHKRIFVVFVGKLKDHVINLLGLKESFFQKYEKFMISQVEKTWPSEYMREMKGISKAVDLHESYIISVNIIFDFISLCVSAAQYDSDIDDVVHVRNLDFGAMFGWDYDNSKWIINECIQPLLITVNFKSKGVTQYRSVTFAGCVGVLTGMRPNAFAISINARISVKGGFSGMMDHFYKIDNNQSFISLATREILAKSRDYETAVNARLCTHFVICRISSIKMSLIKILLIKFNKIKL